MKIYSGECCLCDCGIETSLIDNSSEKLKTGDIVMVAHRDDSGFMILNGLSVIVSNQYTTFSDGTIVANTYEHKPFVMGLAEVNINDDENWIVKKVKGHEDALDGEHWKDFGFCFKK